MKTVFRPIDSDAPTLDVKRFRNVVLVGRKIYEDQQVLGKKVRRPVGYHQALPVIPFNNLRGKHGESMIFRPEPYTDPQRFHTGRFLYLGEIVNHYGHLLLDSMSRLWPLADGSIAPDTIDGFVFVWDEEKHLTEPFHGIVRSILQSLGIAERDCIFVGEPNAFEELLLPTQSSVIGWYCDPNHACWADKVRDHLGENQAHGRRHRIYFSRRLLSSNQRVMRNEAELEAMLHAGGWDIHYPEQMTFEEQVACCANSEIIMGSEGSALLNSLFMPPGSTVIILGSEQAKRNRTQARVCAAKNQSLFLFDTAVAAEWSMDLNALSDWLSSIACLVKDSRD